MSDGSVAGHYAECGSCNEDLAIRGFLNWCRAKGWTLMAHNGFNSYIPSELYTAELNTSGGSALDVDKVMAEWQAAPGWMESKP